MPITLDVTRFPLVITTATGLLTDAAYKTYLLEFRAATLDRRQTYAHVYDASSVEKMASTQRSLQADYIVAHREQIARYNKGTAFVLHSPLVRGLLTAVQWMSPPPYPYTIVASREQAITWCVARLG